MTEKPKPIGVRVSYYYNPKTQLWVRATREKEYCSADISTWEWRPFEALLQRHREKLSLLFLCEPAPADSHKLTLLEGVGKVRWSRSHKAEGLLFFTLANEAWRKEL